MSKFRIIASVIATLCLLIAFLLPVSDDIDEQVSPDQASDSVAQISAPVTSNPMTSNTVGPKPAIPEPAQETQPTRTLYMVKVGDTLSGIFSELNIPYNTLQELLSVDLNYLQLDLIKPGEELELMTDSNNRLLSLTYHISLVEKAIYTLEDDNTYSYEFKEIPSEWNETLISGSISGSFSVSAHKLGLSSTQIANITWVLRDKINFARSLRAGDRFDVLVRRQFLGDLATGNSEIKAISFKVSGGEISAFLAQDGRFYDREGNSLERAFNRYPVDKKYRRITSGFNQNRKHPVTGKVSPHNGTDFATPVGAPIYSTGDGKVISVKNHPYAGKYLVIEHNGVYKTRYLHLSKFLVKNGQQVKRGDKIALSGATGRLTGPHLHFEVLVRNHPVDSMKADLPIARSISSKAKASLLSRISEFDALVLAEQSSSI